MEKLRSGLLRFGAVLLDIATSRLAGAGGVGEAEAEGGGVAICLGLKTTFNAQQRLFSGAVIIHLPFVLFAS